MGVFSIQHVTGLCTRWLVLVGDILVITGSSVGRLPGVVFLQNGTVD